MEFRVLGQLEVRSTGHVIGLGGERQQKLLAVLLLHRNVVVPFERLVDEMWSDPPPTARRQVYNASAALRRAICGQAGPGHCPTTTTVGYLMRLGEDELDIDLFHRQAARAQTVEAASDREGAIDLYTAALDLWRGPVLDGLRSPLIDGVAETLNEERLTVLERLAGLQLQLGEHRAVTAGLRDVVETHPLRESLRGKLMLALVRGGRRAEALSVYEEGRRHFVRELGLDVGRELQDLHQRILRGDPGLRPAPRPVAAETGVSVSFLPPEHADVIGRESEIARLLAAVERTGDRAPAVVAIDGMGGVGKTALAVHVARRLADEYPDGAHFVDLGGVADHEGPTGPPTAVNQLLRQRGIVEDPTADRAARLARWRAETDGKRLLVVLDNAAEAGDVQPLLPRSPGSLAIVTSRRQMLALPAVIPFTLHSLLPAAGATMFADIAGADRIRGEERDLDTLVRLCGGLPLAIRALASRLRHRPYWTVAELLERFQDQPRRDRALTVDGLGVSAVLGRSYRYLTGQQQRMLRLLWLVPGPDVDAYAAAALADLPLVEAEGALEDLVEQSLLLQSTVGRYLMHTLVRDCARELSEQHDTDTDRDLARHRLLDYYLHFAHIRCLPLAKGQLRFRPDVSYPPVRLPVSRSAAENIEQLKAEQDNLIAAARFAAENGWDTHAWQLPCLLLPFFGRINSLAGSATYRSADRA